MFSVQGGFTYSINKYLLSTYKKLGISSPNWPDGGYILVDITYLMELAVGGGDLTDVPGKHLG